MPGYAVYPVAVLAGVPALFRSFAVGSIRGSVAPRDRGRFLIVDQGQSIWRGLVGYRLPDDPSVILLDKAGNVLARESGPFDEKSYQDAAARIRSAAGRTSTSVTA